MVATKISDVPLKVKGYFSSPGGGAKEADVPKSPYIVDEYVQYVSTTMQTGMQYASDQTSAVFASMVVAEQYFS